MSAELVRRLRLGFFSDVATEIASKAADEIERLTAERDALSAQLRAAREQEPMAHIDDLGHIQFTDGGKLKRGDRLYAAPVPPPAVDRRIVCAAIRHSGTGLVVCGARHFDDVMHGQLMALDGLGMTDEWDEQGFIDQRGNFLTREEAFAVASAAGQIMRRCGGDDGRLFSENLY